MINGVVTNIVNNAPVKTATVTFLTMPTSTNQLGGYALTGVACQTGLLTVSAPGFQVWKEPYTPRCGVTNKKDIVLIPIGVTSISGIVRDNSPASRYLRPRWPGAGE